MRIRDIRDPTLFQRLVRTLFAAAYGHEFQTVDDSSGDRGNDGYDGEAGWLLAIYCPEKGQQQKRTLEKARDDLRKATKLRSEPGYHFDQWLFITPEPLPEQAQATLRAEALERGLRATFLSADNLEPMYLSYPHLHELFPELNYPRVEAELKTIGEKLDRLLEEPRKGQATPAEGAGATRARGPQDTDTEYVVDLFVGFRSDELASIQARLFAGDATARHDLERYRLEAQGVRERLVAMMIEVEFEAERLNWPLVERLAFDGAKLALDSHAGAEAAVFAARRAYAMNMRLVTRDSDFTARLGLSLRTGAPLVSEAEAESYDREVPVLREEVNQLFKSAYAGARDSKNLYALFTVVSLYANATTHGTFPLRMPGRERMTPDIGPRLAHAKELVESSYDLLITLAAGLRSKRLLAMAYSNFANDLRVFGDNARALSHAGHAFQLANEADDEHQKTKTSALVDALQKDVESKKE